MNELSVVGAEPDYGIRELSIEDIDMVSGGWRTEAAKQAALYLFDRGVELGYQIYTEWDTISRNMEQAIEAAWTYHHFHGYYRYQSAGW